MKYLLSAYYLQLPIKVDIIKHKHEIDGKSTAVHGAILAPNDVKIYTYPDIPNYSEKEKIYLIYPSVSAKDVASLFHTDLDISNMSLDEKPKHNRTLMVKSLDSNKINNDVCDLDELPIERAVFIDSTWNQSRGIYKDERIKRLPCLVIQNRASQFWRHQKGSPRWYLSTIEAIHQFVLEIHLNMWGVDPYYEGPYCDSFREIKRRNSKSDIRPYCGQYDNLLFFFTHMYKKIHSIYKHDQLLAYKRRLR